MRLKPILFFLVVGGLSTFLIVRQAKEGQPGVINIGQEAPDFSIKNLAGKEIHLSDYRGKLVFLNFWASWCGPCIEEMPELETMNKAFKDRKFQMLAVSTDVEPENARKFYDDAHFTMGWFSDPGRRVAEKYHVSVYPETFIIDANGHVIKHYPGPVNTQVMAQIEGYIRNQEAAESTPTQ